MVLPDAVVPVTPTITQDYERAIPPEPIPPKPPETSKPEEPHVFEKPTYYPAKPIPCAPKISPSSIPIPNPSVTTTKQVEAGYPNYGGYLYSTPGYSAFHPVNHAGVSGYHPGLVQPNQILPAEHQNPDFLPFSQPNVQPLNDPIVEEESRDTDILLMVTDDEETQQPPPQTDFEEHFTPEIISTVSTVLPSEVSKPTESKMNITSLAQGSGATVTIPSSTSSKENHKKPERFSLKTSIPISKIDMKCVSNPPDSVFQNSLTKKTFNPSYTKDSPRVEIQSNIVIKSATKEPEINEAPKPVALGIPNNNISTLINAAEVVNKTENQFRVPEVPKIDTESKNPASGAKPLFNPMNIETTKSSLTKPSDREPYISDAKNQILFIQNKNNNNQNSKMLLTIQQQNPQVLLQRTNFESKNLQAPSRLLSQSKKSKDDVLNEGNSSKVVALKRLHQENCDEDDFENLITENQIYGNKIVVKEKSQGTLQEQDLKNKNTVAEKVIASEAKNVVLQPNFLYVSNVQFPNMMIVKNSAKLTQTTDINKTKTAVEENKVLTETKNSLPTTDVNIVSTLNKNAKVASSVISKEVHVLKSTNNVTQTLHSNLTKPEVQKPELVTKTDLNLRKPESIVIKKSEMKINSDVVMLKSDIMLKPDIMSKPNTLISKPDMVISKFDVPISKPNKISKPDMIILKSDTITSKSNIVISKPDIIMSQPHVAISKPDIVQSKSNIILSKSDTLISKPDIVITKPELLFQTSQPVIMKPQIVYQVPISSIVEGDKISHSTLLNIGSKDYTKFVTQNQDYNKPFEQAKLNEKLYIACPYQMDSKHQPKIVITNLRPKINKIDELSSLDVYEKRRRLRRLKYLSNREVNGSKDMKTDVSSSTSTTQPVKKTDKSDLRNSSVISPDKINIEIYKEFISAKGKLDETGSCSDSDDFDEVESKLYESIIEEYGDRVKTPENEKTKSDFLSNFRLASPENYKEKELDLQERMLLHDKVRSAYAKVGRLDMLWNDPQEEPMLCARPEPLQLTNCIVGETNLTMVRKKTMFLSRLKLTQATQKYKEEYEKAWQVIVKERHRRNGTADEESHSNITWPTVCLDTKGQLQTMSEIKQSVNENNNLIKKIMDTVSETQTSEESISMLAEKNFSELNRLSQMADHSVKLVSGQNTGQRDLNPGFDSENIQKQDPQTEQPVQNYPNLNIPNISNIISLKSTQECQGGVTTQATSMDEPRSSAAGVTEIIIKVLPHAKTVDACCQVEENNWLGVEKLIRIYREYDTVRRREMSELQRRNTMLRVDGALITRAASRESDRARALLAERQNLVLEETNLRLSLRRLQTAIDGIKNYKKYINYKDFC